MYKYFLKNVKTGHISLWKSKGLSDEIIEPPTSDNSLAPALSYIGTRTRLKLNERCLKQDEISFTHRKTLNLYIVYDKH